MTLATFIVHCGKHKQRRKRGLYSTHVRQLCRLHNPNVYQQTQIQSTTLTVSNVQSSIQRKAFAYVNIVHMELDDVAVSQKHRLC